MDSFLLKIVTPDGSAVDAEVESVLIRTTSGDIGILKNHINYVATIDYGLVKITYPDHTERGACCMNGFVRVDKDMTRIIATTFEFADQIDLARAQKAKAAAEERLAETTLSDDERELAKARLKRAENRIRVYELNQ